MALVKSEDNSTIGEGSFFKGRFMVRGTLRVEGRLEGEVLQVDQLYVGQKGKVKTDITANYVEVEGLVIGDIIAKNRVFLLPTSKVLGDIKTPELIIKSGVVLEGKCHIGEDLINSPKELLEKLYNEN